MWLIDNSSPDILSSLFEWMTNKNVWDLYKFLVTLFRMVNELKIYKKFWHDINYNLITDNAIHLNTSLIKWMKTYSRSEMLIMPALNSEVKTLFANQQVDIQQTRITLFNIDSQQIREPDVERKHKHAESNWLHSNSHSDSGRNRTHPKPFVNNL